MRKPHFVVRILHASYPDGQCVPLVGYISIPSHSFLKEDGNNSQAIHNLYQHICYARSIKLNFRSIYDIIQQEIMGCIVKLQSK